MTNDEYLALLAHELRGPIAAISSAADVLDAGEVGAAVSTEARQVVARQAQRLASLLDELLELGRLRSHASAQAQRIDLVALLRDTANVRLESALDELRVGADGARLQDALARCGTSLEVALAAEDGKVARLTIEPGGGLAIQFVRVLLEAAGANVAMERGAKGRRLVARLPR